MFVRAVLISVACGHFALMCGCQESSMHSQSYTTDWPSSGDGGSGLCHEDYISVVECPNDGSCIPLEWICDGQNDCSDGYDEEFCDSNHCDANPCQNGGTCVAYDGETYCLCPYANYGDSCENVLPCSTILCENGGTCVASNDGSTSFCVCPDQFTGEFCEREISSPCQSYNCTNGGYCRIDDKGDAHCVCPSGTTGRLCETLIVPVNPCSSSPCRNNGVCIAASNNADGYTCSCLEGWTGPSCQIGTGGNRPLSQGLVIGAVVGGVVFVLIFIVIVVAICCCLVRNKTGHPPRLNAGPAATLTNPQYASRVRTPKSLANDNHPPPYDNRISSQTRAHVAPPPPRPESTTPSGYQMPMQQLPSQKKPPRQPPRTPEEEYVYANNVYEELPDTLYMEPTSQDVNQNQPIADREYMDLTEN